MAVADLSAAAERVRPLFADEYVTASFAEVCSVFNRALGQVLARPGVAIVRPRDRVRRVSAGVASAPVEWRDLASPSGWSAGEVRVLQVQSGDSPETELMIAAPATVPAAEAREFLEALAASVQAALVLAAPVG